MSDARVRDFFKASCLRQESPRRLHGLGSSLIPTYVYDDSYLMQKHPNHVHSSFDIPVLHNLD